MRKLKIISLILAVVLLLSVIPMFGTTAAENIITSENQLISAAENGGSVTILGEFNINQCIEVKKNLTINLKFDTENYNPTRIYLNSTSQNPYDVGFVISPTATLTINSENSTSNGIEPHFQTDIFELQANAQSGAGLVINGGHYAGMALVRTTATATDAKPTVIFNNGEMYNYTFVEGIADVTINAGIFNLDATQYVSNNSYVIPNYYGSSNTYKILKLADEFSNDFKKFINADGKFVINRYSYTEDNDYDVFLDNVQAILNKDAPSGKYFEFKQTEAEKAQNKALISLNDGMTGEGEHHLLEYVFNYDSTVYEATKTVINSLPKGEDTYYTYNIADLEFLDYSLGLELGKDNVANAINYSKDFKNAIDSAYSVYFESKMGGGGNLFKIQTAGVGMLIRDGIVYGIQNMGVTIDNIMYVPADTANTASAFKAALQTRLDRLYGQGKVTIHESTLFDAYLWNEFSIFYDWISQEYPNPTFEAYKNKEYGGYYPALPDPEDPDYDEQVKDFVEQVMGLENATFDTPAFLMEINGICYPIKIEANANITMPAEPEKEPEPTPEEKPVEETEIKLVQEDIKTEVEYEAGTFPTNTVVKVEQQKQGEIVERAKESLKEVAKEIAVFEITAKSNNVTVQPNGKVKVTFALPTSFDPVKTALYYVSDDGKYEFIPVKVDAEKRIATAELSHFSTYVLVQTTSSPATGNNGVMLLLLAIAFVSGATVVYSIKKIKA